MCLTFIFFECYPNHRILHSFPTRRSSDHRAHLLGLPVVRVVVAGRERVRPDEDAALRRSEEHTSELPSRPHLVCPPLLEKKNHHRPAGRVSPLPPRHSPTAYVPAPRSLPQ